MSTAFRPASSISDRHGLFVALVGGTSSGKSYSALRLARGIAGPQGKVAVIDTEGGRMLHLKSAFSFDVNLMDPPFRPERFSEAAADAEAAGYDVLVIDSFSMEWAGIGGVLDYQADELQRMAGDDWKKRERVKMASWIRPKSAHKAMVYSFLQRRIPIIFSIRGEETVKPGEAGERPTKIFKAICNSAFLFEVTLSFRLATERKGIIDLSDLSTYKMEGAHAAIFKDGEQLSEKHGEQLAQWATGGAPAAKKPAPASPPPEAVGAAAPPPPSTSAAAPKFKLPDDLQEHAKLIATALRQAKDQVGRERIIAAQTKSGVLLKIKNANVEAYDWLIEQATPKERAA